MHARLGFSLTVLSDPDYGVAERNSCKSGAKTLGTNIPIIPEDEVRAKKPDFPVVFFWRFMDLFVVRGNNLLSSGTRVIVPLPEVRIIDGQASIDHRSVGAGWELCS